MLKLYTDETKVHRRRSICIKDCEFYDSVESENRPLTIRVVVHYDTSGRLVRHRRNPPTVVFCSDQVRVLDEFKAELEECGAVFEGSDLHLPFASSTASKMKNLLRRKSSAVRVDVQLDDRQRLEKLASRKVIEWDKGDVLVWLDVIGLRHECEESFAENDLDGALLRELDEITLSNVGIPTDVIPQMIREIGALKSPSPMMNFGSRIVHDKLARSFSYVGFADLIENLSDPSKFKHRFLSAADVAAMGRGRRLSGYGDQPLEQFRESCIQAKIVLLTVPRSGRRMELRHSISPIMSDIPFPGIDANDLRAVRSGVIIGPWYLEWSDFEVIIPKRMISGRDLLLADVDTLNVPKEMVPILQDKIARCVVKWNTSYRFGVGEDGETEGEVDRGPTEFERTPQMFVDEVLETLGVSTDFGGASDVFFGRLRKRGTSPLVFQPSDEFREFFNVREEELTFVTHEDLDFFCREIRNECLDIYLRFAPEWSLLKSFDRIFWSCHVRDPDNAVFRPCLEMSMTTEFLGQIARLTIPEEQRAICSPFRMKRKRELFCTTINLGLILLPNPRNVFLRPSGTISDFRDFCDRAGIHASGNELNVIVLTSTKCGQRIFFRVEKQ